MKYKFYSSRDKRIIELCKEKKVLHIGPCDWPYTQEKIDRDILLYARIDDVCSEQLGLDIDQESIELLESKKYKKSRIIHHDMNEALDLDFIPDIIIFGETIEHLTNVGVAFDSLKKFMGPKTQMIISTPNAYAVNNFLNGFFGKEYQHPDHSVLFSQQTLTQMCNKNNLQVLTTDFSVLDSALGRKLNLKGKVVGFITHKIGHIFPMLAPTLLFTVQLSNKNDC